MTGYTLTTLNAGDWSDISIWWVTMEGVNPHAYGQLPTAEDDVRITKRVVIDTDAVCHDLTLKAGGELVSKGTLEDASIMVSGAVSMDATSGYSSGEVRLDGVMISARPFVGADGTGTLMLTDTGNADIIIDDSGIYNASATLQDIKPEGCAKAYARKIGNSVRYLTVTVRIRRGMTSPYTSGIMVAAIYRLAEGPSQVLAYNGSCIIKGFIESVVYDQASVGTAYHVLRVTIAEGQQ